jgi:Arc/MetJ family transcription regulator
MADLDSIAPQFRLATERWPEAPTLSNHYKAVAECHAGIGHSLIATVKSFIECVCITILGEFGRPMPCSNPSTTELLVEALDALGLQNTRGASKISKLLSAHNKMADALTEMRDENDPVAHGRDGFLDTLTTNECRAFLITADTILALLLSAYEGKEPNLQYTREPYDRFAHLNERIDRSVTVEAVIEDGDETQLVVFKVRGTDPTDETEIRAEPSKVLYALDRTAYVGFLESSPAKAVSPQASAQAVPAESLATSGPAPPTATLVSTYQGMLSPVKASLDQYLESLQLQISVAAPDGGNLSDSLLATAEQHIGLDWTKREALQAAMKVALRRTLVRFGIEQSHADKTAENLVFWLKTQTAGLTGTEHA